MRPNQNSSKYLHSLDGWRAVAIFSVLLFHERAALGKIWAALRLPQRFGWIGVQLFFAISGVLICTRMLQEEAERGKISLRNFYIRRAFRILPPALIYLIVVAVLGALSIIPFDARSWLGALLFYRNYLHYFFGSGPRDWFTSHFWSLSVEEHFYFLLPSILVFLPRFRRGTLLVLALASGTWMMFYLYGPHAQIRPAWDQRTEFSLPILLIPAVFTVWLRKDRFRVLMMRYLSPFIGLGCGAVGAFSLAAPAVFRHFPWILGPFIAAISFPLLLISTVLHPDHPVTEVLEWVPLKYLGRISYSVYLWQELFFTRNYTFSEYSIHVLQRPGLDLVCTLVCAIVSYKFIELPAMRLGRRVAKSRHPTSSPQDKAVAAKLIA